jgi:hypothetical protein
MTQPTQIKLNKARFAARLEMLLITVVPAAALLVLHLIR